ncbi:MFS transporter [Candidimonas sp. SYP-B2681]|uniref:MFS transporter n=1 Tax=Candidimonas sp. SYP-B2681 TaxID=2497686 RepID=UPI000F87E6E4|nr:MFS transporter [Candidimonas sp. SYP-B2681]RTZ48230.1 MFS transporter [Candidimonas sp. SYP-B2681]
MCVGVMGTALASPLYPLYQDVWHLKASDITVIFTIYMFGVLASLLFLGRLTNRFGFLPMLRAGLIVVTLGVLLSMVAWNPESFMLSRLAIGLASGLITTSASIGMSQLSRAGDVKRAAVITTFAMTLGFGLGPLVGGLIAQWVPKPLFSAYLPSLLLGLIAIYALFTIRIPPLSTPAASAHHRKDWLTQLLPRITMPPRALSRPFWIGSMGAFSAFGMFSLYASLAPSFMQDILSWHGPAASGASIAAILFLSSTFQLAARRVPNKMNAVAGYGALVVSNLLLIATTYTGLIWLFMLSALTTALGHGLANLAGMSLVNKMATPASRAGLLSSYMIVGYLGTIVPILGMGWLSDRLGLAYAIMIFSASMTAVTAILTWAAHTTQPVPSPGN